MHRAIAAVLAALALTIAVPAAARADDAALTASLQKALGDYVTTRSKPEHISAASLSISFEGASENIDLTAGTTQYAGAGAKATPADLYQIGSNTKAFTAVAILQLEAAGTLSIDDTLGKWLPQYPAWNTVTIRSLLNMTSPIPSYDNQPAFGELVAKDPHHTFTPAEIIAFAYPHNGNPTPVGGWTYSNTNYFLAQLIIEKASGKSYAEVVRSLFDRVGLKNTFYEQNTYPSAIRQRMVDGYFYNHDPGNELMAPYLGHDVKNDSVSFLQGTGGIVSTMGDVARWSRALYAGPLLAEKQRHELMSLVSRKTGEPIATTSQGSPPGFGLGVGQITQPNLGTYWYYLGETDGYRVGYGYFPASGTLIAIGLNSRPDAEQDHIGALLLDVYATLKKAGKT
jgi:D-alanyl-D-alanine carboxypeptidase